MACRVLDRTTVRAARYVLDEELDWLAQCVLSDLRRQGVAVEVRQLEAGAAFTLPALAVHQFDQLLDLYVARL